MVELVSKTKSLLQNHCYKIIRMHFSRKIWVVDNPYLIMIAYGLGMEVWLLKVIDISN
jgi:hypothetical protein